MLKRFYPNYLRSVARCFLASRSINPNMIDGALIEIHRYGVNKNPRKQKKSNRIKRNIDSIHINNASS